MENDYLQGRNKYPTPVTSAYHLITNWKQDPRKIMQSLGQVGNVGVSFTTTTEGTNNNSEVTLTNATKSGNGASKAHITCHKCNVKGHYANDVQPIPLPSPKLEQQCTCLVLREMIFMVTEKCTLIFSRIAQHCNWIQMGSFPKPGLYWITNPLWTYSQMEPC